MCLPVQKVVEYLEIDEDELVRWVQDAIPPQIVVTHLT
jgi:hypothetical protein